jgi:hypothetical protein
MFPEVKALVASQILEFDKLLALEKALLDKDRKSLITKKIKEVDARTNSDIVGMRANLTAAIHKHDPAIVDAARTILYRLHQLGNVYSKPYEEQTALLTVLLTDLKGRFAPLVTLTGILTWVNEIETDNAELTQLLAQRNTEIAFRVQGDVREIHAQLEARYRRMTSIFDADVLLNGDATCGDFILELNTNILYFNEHDTPHTTRKDIKDVTINEIPDQSPTGKPIAVIPEVYYTHPERPTVQIFFPTDFNLTYRNNILPGTAEVILHGKGRYKGRKIMNFNISDSDSTIQAPLS